MLKILFPIYYELKSIKKIEIINLFWSFMGLFLLTELEKISHNAYLESIKNK